MDRNFEITRGDKPKETPPGKDKKDIKTPAIPERLAPGRNPLAEVQTLLRDDKEWGEAHFGRFDPFYGFGTSESKDSSK